MSPVTTITASVFFILFECITFELQAIIVNYFYFASNMNKINCILQVKIKLS